MEQKEPENRAVLLKKSVETIIARPIYMIMPLTTSFTVITDISEG